MPRKQYSQASDKPQKQQKQKRLNQQSKRKRLLFSTHQTSQKVKNG